MFFKDDKAKGSAALEYLIVTVFASAIAFGFVAFSNRVIKEKISKTLSSLGIEESVQDLDFLNLE